MQRFKNWYTGLRAYLHGNISREGLALALLNVASAPFYGVGWLLGFVWWLIRFWWSVFAVGMKDGANVDSN